MPGNRFPCISNLVDGHMRVTTVAGWMDQWTDGWMDGWTDVFY